ncbi:hypothetical protein B296_00054412 [Ensete ventricosum]|uniref:Pentacotripeptide-repeat region of PRORP domain-containing protein n=1 Tax=Ensete ventricosum TaxID=4639 RepID=A0A426Y4L4_ENSVE|nr:hypothetical protein B296_00054412 [Ensete ventricosum]
MALLLSNSRHGSPFRLSASFALDGLRFPSADPHPSDPITPPREDGPGDGGWGGGGGRPVRLARGPPLPLPRSPDPPPHRRLHRPRHQAPPFLPRSLPCNYRPPHLQGQVPQFLLNPASPSFSTSCGSPSPSDSDADLDADPDPDPTCSTPLRPSDPKMVERVCKVIEDLFASDRNMEAVLDECNVDLSPSLVVDVLERFRHAHKPAYRFFRWAGERSGYSHDSDTYTKMLGVLGKTRQFETMVSLLEEMGNKGFLNMDAFKIAIKAFAAAREMKKAMWIFQLMKRFDFKAGVETFNYLIEALAKGKLGKEAQALFEKLKDQYPPDLRTYTLVLLGWCNLKNLVEAGRVWNEMSDKGFKPDVVAYNTLVDGLIRGQRRSDAIKLFELMKAKGPVPNARTYTILIHDLCKVGKMDLAVNCFQEMLDAGCLPNVATYTCLIVGFGKARQMDKVSGLLREMTAKGCPPDAQTYNALIKLMTVRNMPDDAARIYKKMINKGFEPTKHTYNMMMKSYFHGNNYEMGCEVWEEMGRRGICPDVNSYTVFIGGHIRHGRPEEAHRYIEEMISKGMKAPQIDYNKFAAEFSRVGKPDMLYELAQKMNFSGKFEVAHVFYGWAERMKNRVKRRVPNHTGKHLF